MFGFIAGYTAYLLRLASEPRELFLEAILETGAYTSITFAVAVVFLCTLFLPLGFPIGIFLGSFAARALWNKGLENANVAQKHRAVPTWRGARQQDVPELTENDYWFLPWFVGKDEFDMKEQTDVVLNIPIETEDQNTVPTDVGIQWQPKARQLYYYGNVQDVVKALNPEIQSAARAFGVSRKDIDHLVDTGLPEKLKVVVKEHLTRRANGEVNNIEVTEDGTARFTKIGDAPPWGIDILSITVPNFTLPPGVTQAAAEEAEAARRKKAAETEMKGMQETIDGLIKKGINPTAAMSMAASMTLPPDKQPAVNTENRVYSYTGLEGVAKNVVDGLIAVLGKQPASPPAAPQEPIPPAPAATT